MENTKETYKQLNEIFSYKAEWLKEHLFELYTEPNYFPELISPRPCMLIGGRGTGKTTTLKGLSYEGQYQINNENSAEIKNWSYYGLYFRINTNRVTIFKGPELSEEIWSKLFAHYFNLLICKGNSDFLIWYQEKMGKELFIPERNLRRICISLHLLESKTIKEFNDRIVDEIITFESQINNITDEHKEIKLSAQGAPIDLFMQVINELPEFKDKNFFILLDEYENFLDYQQRVVNTLVKHSGPLYSFKIGIRDLGLRVRSTLNPDEQLNSPADYDRIEISQKFKDSSFSTFAKDVCNRRMNKLRLTNESIPQSIEFLFPGLTEDEEAEKLGAGEHVGEIIRDIEDECKGKNLDLLNTLKPLEIYLLKIWADNEGTSVGEQYLNMVDKPKAWKTRYDNYKYAILFTIKKGKVGIRKYYSGWETFTKISGSNIRYLLELIDSSFRSHLQNGNSLTTTISHEIQTKSAQIIGQKNLAELEGLSIEGARLTKLLLGIGRIFQVMAASVGGHTPEVNQFHLAEESLENHFSEVHKILTACVRHLALIRYPGNKLADEADIREYDYMIHPIFSAFFVFSYRQKRKMILTNNQFLGLINDHQKTIKEILSQNKRILTDDDSLPEQLSLFEGFYHGLN